MKSTSTSAVLGTTGFANSAITTVEGVGYILDGEIYNFTYLTEDQQKSIAEGVEGYNSAILLHEQLRDKSREEGLYKKCQELDAKIIKDYIDSILSHKELCDVTDPTKIIYLPKDEAQDTTCRKLYKKVVQGHLIAIRVHDECAELLNDKKFSYLKQYDSFIKDGHEKFGRLQAVIDGESIKYISLATYLQSLARAGYDEEAADLGIANMEQFVQHFKEGVSSFKQDHCAKVDNIVNDIHTVCRALDVSGEHASALESM
jgi:hypothetical protein